MVEWIMQYKTYYWSFGNDKRSNFIGAVVRIGKWSRQVDMYSLADFIIGGRI